MMDYISHLMINIQYALLLSFGIYNYVRDLSLVSKK